MEEVEQSLLAIKVLRRLLVAGFEHPNREKEVQEFWTITQRHFGEFLSLVVGDFTNLSSHVHKLVEKHLLQLSKLHLEMAKVHPAAFVVLPDCVPLVRAYWGLVVKLGKTYGSRELINSAKISADGDADDEEKPLQEKLGLKALLLIRACAKMAFNPTHTFKYQHPEDKEEKKVSIDLIKTALLSEGFVIEMMELLVTRFFVFRQSDLREWEEEPEEWEKREEEIADAWEFSIRSCSEKLFLDLIINFKQLLVPRLLHVFYSYACTFCPASFRSLADFKQLRTIGKSYSKIHYILLLALQHQAWSNSSTLMPFSKLPSFLRSKFNKKVTIYYDVGSLSYWANGPRSSLRN